MSNVSVPSFTLRQKLLRTFGPVLTGLIGGALAGMVGLPSVLTLLRNVAATYDRFPSLERSWIADNFDLPDGLAVPCMILGFLAPFMMGLATVLLVKPRDIWGDLSAGLTTGLSGTLATFATGLGWAVVLAMVVVPSISDVSKLGDSVHGSSVETTEHPSKALVATYPDLEGVEPEQRGSAIFSKIMADQVVGSFWGVTLGLLLAVASSGMLGLCGTLAGGYLVRRGDSFRSIVLPYLELTVSWSMMLALPFRKMLATGLSWYPPTVEELPPFFAVVLLTLFIFRAVANRWNWIIRLLLAAGFGTAWQLTDGREIQLIPALWLAWVTAVVVLAVREQWSPIMRANLLLGWLMILPHVLGWNNPIFVYVDLVVYASIGILLLQHFDHQWRSRAVQLDGLTEAAAV